MISSNDCYILNQFFSF